MADATQQTPHEGNTEQPEEAPEPHEIFARTREEDERRPTRSSLELTTSSLVAGFDVVFVRRLLDTQLASELAKGTAGPLRDHVGGGRSRLLWTGALVRPRRQPGTQPP